MKKSTLTNYVSGNFPSWSEARQNPISVAKIFANTLGWLLDDIENRINNVYLLNYLKKVNPLSEPFHGYVTPPYGWHINEPDINWEDALQKVPVRELIGVIGDEEDQSEPTYYVPITLVDTTNEYLYNYPTDYYIETKLPINETNKYIPNVFDDNNNPVTYTTAAKIFSIIDNKAYIMLDYTKEKLSYIEVEIPEGFIEGEMKQPRIYNGEGDIIEEEMGEVYGGPYTQDEAIDFYIDNGDYLQFDIKDDPLVTRISRVETISGESKRLLLPHYIIDGSLSIINTTDNSNISASIEYTPGAYTTDKYLESCDFNNDGIIDEHDLDELQYNIGKSMNNYSPSEWESKYAKYDLNKDGEIDERDLEIIQQRLNSVKYHGTIITFQTNGIFNIEYDMITDGLTEAIIDIGRGVTYLPTKKYINDQPLSLNEDWKFAVWSELLNSIIYLNKNEHKLTIIKHDEYLGNTVKDKWDIYLPLRTKEDKAISIDIYKNDLYVLMLYDGNYVIVRYRLDDNFNDEYDIRYIHSNKTDKIGIDKKIRDKEGITDPIGLKVISTDLMIIIDRIGNGFLNVKLIKGIYDYAIIDTFHENGKQTLFTREKYDKLKSGENILDQVYYHIWNRFDDFAFELGLYRIPGEGNINLRKRIFHYLEHYPDPSREKIELEIHREFMIDDQAFISDHAIWGVSIWGTVTWG